MPMGRRQMAAGMSSGAGTGKKETLGLMSRKMMLLRSKSGGNASRATPISSGATDFVPSSPVLQDVGNLAGPDVDSLQLPPKARRTASGSSSSGLSGMTAFLEKYGRAGVSSDDDALYDSGDAPTPSAIDGSRNGEAIELDEQRRRQEQEEYESAVLSKRAEAILANAKKRLNVMEGNLRGARDLVTPLTAANLKRATSLSGGVYGNGRILRYDYDNETQSSPRRLHTQQSSPSMGNDFQGHNRGWSEHRPYTSLDHHPQYIMVPQNLRAPARASEQAQERTLRASRSYDALGASGSRPLHHRQSPDSGHLAALPEDEERRLQQHVRQDSSPSINNGLGNYRPASRTSDLRDQMSSLKGRISSLKDRAREDSLKRQSQSSLRSVSLFNNATSTPPELYYTGTPVQDEEHETSPWTNSDGAVADAPLQGSRNAFAEAAAAQRQQFQQARVVEVRRTNTPESKGQCSESRNGQRRIPGGTAVITSAKSRYKHHQPSHRQSSQGTIDLPRAYIVEQEADLSVPSPAFSSDEYLSSPPSSTDNPPDMDAEEAPSEAEISIYEDANEHNPVVAHEDREDAFDYEHFFLSSALGSYSAGRRGSNSSEDSVSSVETARGPVLAEEDDDEKDIFPPPAPQTPEKLRQIERSLHERKLSDESVATTATFATAEEDPGDDDPVSPLDERDVHRTSYMNNQSRSVSPLEAPARVHNRGDSSSTQDSSSTYRASPRRQSKPRRDIVAKRHVLRRNSSSDRADSGVGMSNRHDQHRPHTSTGAYKHANKLSNGSALSTPPASPHDFTTKIDPTTVAVQALLDPNGKALGLRNKAVLFGIVESLRKVVGKLQEEDDMTFASRMLRNTLDEAKRTLDGL